MAAAILAAAMASFRKPSALMRAVAQHVSAGVVFAAVALEIGPDLLRRNQPISTVFGFSAGVIVFLLIREITQRSEATSSATERTFSASYVFSIAADCFVDGMMIGIGFAAGGKAGLLLTTALTLELMSLGLALAAELPFGKHSRAATIGTTTALTCLVPLGAILSMVVLRQMPGSIVNGTIAAGAAALLYLVTEELLRKAHERPESPLITATFFAGFLAVLLIDMKL